MRVERVGLLAWSLPPDGSGLGRAALEIATALTSLGVEVVVFDAGRPIASFNCEPSFSVVGCAPPERGLSAALRKLPVFGHLVAPWYFRRQFKRENSKASFDVLEATNWYAPAFALAFGRTPLVVRNSTPAIDAHSSDMSLRDRVDLCFAHWMEKYTAYKATALISNTQSHRRMVAELYDVERDQIHEVVSLALDPETLARGARADPATKNSDLQLLFIGRAERRKGFEEMLGGFLIANRERRNLGQRLIKLTVVGVDAVNVDHQLVSQGFNPPDRREVTVHKTVSDEELHDLYSAATAVIAPSRYESFGLVYREAAAFGRPLIACAEDPAAVDFIKEAECGILADTCSPLAIADAIRILFANRSLCDQLGAAGRLHAKSLSRDQLGRDTLTIYSKAVVRSASQAEDVRAQAKT